MTATFDCDPSFWEESHKYKLFYPSLAAGWLEDRGYVLTFGFHPENDAHKVADWFSSNWVNGGGNMKFISRTNLRAKVLKFNTLALFL